MTSDRVAFSELLHTKPGYHARAGSLVRPNPVSLVRPNRVPDLLPGGPHPAHPALWWQGTRRKAIHVTG